MEAEPSKLILDAKKAARDYRGGFRFMQDMRRKAQDEKWLPTQKQAIAILKSVAWHHSSSSSRSSWQSWK